MISRRDFLRLGALTAATAAATAATAACSETGPLGLPSADSTPTVASPMADPNAAPALDDDARLLRLVNRAGYGLRPGQWDAIRNLGFTAYLETQLAPDTLDDGDLDRALAREFSFRPDFAVELRDDDRERAFFTLVGGTIVRQLYSQRQLYEAMVSFWSDHFNIYAAKSPFMPALKLVDDLDAIRPHALGSFRELLHASAASPAMLAYLDNVTSRRGAPNENYARELLELHTVGIDAGYTQYDVDEAARVFTGWTVNLGLRTDRLGGESGERGSFMFAPLLHDNGPKTVMGQSFPHGQGQADGRQLLDFLAGHPATANHIATKLVRRFVADEPPPALVAAVAETFLATDGDIKSMLRATLTSDEFAAAPPKLKRPHKYFISTLRALGVQMGDAPQLGRIMQQLGQPLFQWPAPNGYPDVSAAWANNLLPRWNLALALAHDRLGRLRVPWDELLSHAPAADAATVIAFFGQLLYHQPLDDTTAALLTGYVGPGTTADSETAARLRDAVALLVAAPAFQWT